MSSVSFKSSKSDLRRGVHFDEHVKLLPKSLNIDNFYFHHHRSFPPNVRENGDDVDKWVSKYLNSEYVCKKK